MTDDPFTEAPFLEPSPEEDAWEAYLTLALDHLGADGSRGLTNRQLAEVEHAAGHQLPFELGMLLVMGVPDTDGWLDWRTDPATQLADWTQWVLAGIQFDVEHAEFWSPAFGRRPDELSERLDAVASAFPTLPPLFPIHGHRAIPLTPAIGRRSNDGNPVLSVMQTDVIVYGADLAAWLNADFGVPLPTWPADTERHFPFWSELTRGGD